MGRRKEFGDMTGQRFGRWTVLGMTARTSTDGHKRTACLCRCDCGTERVVYAQSLRGGLTKSCGCATKYLRRQLMYIDAYNRFQLKVSDVINGNQKYLERMLRLNQAKQVMKQKEHHDLKISPKYYRDIKRNGKRFEVRFNDRDFKVGDIFNLREWAGGGQYTGRKITCEVKYILDNPDYCKEGYVITILR